MPLFLSRRALRGPVKVLIADDHHAHQALMTALFRAFDCEVEVSGCGVDAAQRARGRAFDLVVLDRHMPRLGGDQVAEQVREPDSASRHALIVSHTTDTPRGPAAALYDRVVAKPMSIPTMLELAQTALAIRNRRAARNRLRRA